MTQDIDKPLSFCYSPSKIYLSSSFPSSYLIKFSATTTLLVLQCWFFTLMALPTTLFHHYVTSGLERSLHQPQIWPVSIIKLSHWNHQLFSTLYVTISFTSSNALSGMSSNLWLPEDLLTSKSFFPKLGIFLAQSLKSLMANLCLEIYYSPGKVFASISNLLSHFLARI